MGFKTWVGNSMWPWNRIKYLEWDISRNHSAIREWSDRVEGQSAIIRNLADQLDHMEMSRDAYRQVGQEQKASNSAIVDGQNDARQVGRIRLS